MCLDTRAGQVTRFRCDGRKPKGQHNGVCYASKVGSRLILRHPRDQVNRPLQGTCA